MLALLLRREVPQSGSLAVGFSRTGHRLLQLLPLLSFSYYCWFLLILAFDAVPTRGALAAAVHVLLEAAGELLEAGEAVVGAAAGRRQEAMRVENLLAGAVAGLLVVVVGDRQPAAGARTGRRVTARRRIPTVRAELVAARRLVEHHAHGRLEMFSSRRGSLEPDGDSRHCHIR